MNGHHTEGNGRNRIGLGSGAMSRFSFGTMLGIEVTQGQN